MNVLIVGYGNIGKVYKSAIENYSKLDDAEVYTLDNDRSKGADYNSFTDIDDGVYFDIAIITTPNDTHFDMANQANGFAQVVLVEKPGFNSLEEYLTAIEWNPNTFIVKNNLFRYEIDHLKYIYKNSTFRSLKWMNANRVPMPGSWFTDYSRSGGGVSKDLIPHLLHLFYYFEDSDVDDLPITISKGRTGSFDKIAYWMNQNNKGEVSEYDNIDYSGKYNVDDYCHVQYNDNAKIHSCWFDENQLLRSLDQGFRLTFGMYRDTLDKILNDIDDEDSIVYFIDYDYYPESALLHVDMGLCPEYAFARMVDYYLNDVVNDFVLMTEQHHMDTWLQIQMDYI